MNPVLKVLNRCLVVEFYRQNAAFFGLLFLVLFGFIKASEHIAIGSFLVANPSTLFFLYVLWIAYGIKVFLFVNPATDLKENQFLEVFILLPLSTKINVIATISVSLFLPIIAYAIFLVSIAVASGFYLAILSLLLAVAITIFLLSFMVLRKLNSIPREKNFNDVAGILLFGFSISLLIYGLLLLKQLELSDFVVRIFWLIVISTFLILFSIHPLLLAFLYIFIGVAITYFWRFKFEFIEKVR